MNPNVRVTFGPVCAPGGAHIDAVAAWHYSIPFGWTTPSWDPRADMERPLTKTVDAPVLVIHGNKPVPAMPL
jgi:hypothetical protein